MSRKEAIQALERHRRECMITCEETCLCWELEALLESEPTDISSWPNPAQEELKYGPTRLESKSEPGEFTKRLRKRIISAKKYGYGLSGLSAGHLITLFEEGLEACDRIDRLEAEKKELKQCINDDMDIRLLKPREVDLILRYPAGRALRLAKAGCIPCIRLPDGEVRFNEQDINKILKPRMDKIQQLQAEVDACRAEIERLERKANG